MTNKTKTKKKQSKLRRIYIFDTTLRDGEQSPGASMTPDEKVKLAQQLDRLGVDVIEAGFPAASPGEVEAIQMLSKKVKHSTIAGLARLRKSDIDAVIKALKYAKKKRLHTFIATSPIHREFKLKKSKDEILADIKKWVSYGKKFFKEVEFSPEDAGRTEFDFLDQAVKVAIEAGATSINVPDTVGYMIPNKFGEMIAKLVEANPILGKSVVLSVHCHNDLGLATANSLSAVLNGANQVECTINGIGERAGNASLEEIAMAIKTRPDVFHAETHIQFKEIMKTSKLASGITGMVVQPNKAIVGKNAFSHESGIHQDGVLKFRETYEIMDPADVGVKESSIVLGKHSGRHAFKAQLKKLGFDPLSESQIERAFEAFKILADRKKNVYDEDIEAIVQDDLAQSESAWNLEYLKVDLETGKEPLVFVRIKKGGKVLASQSTGDGPVDACYKAIERAIGFKTTVTDYSIQSVTSGKDAQGEVTVKVAVRNKEFMGRGVSTDVLEASVKAYLVAINKAIIGS